MEDKKSLIAESDKELEEIAAGTSSHIMSRYTCVNPRCSMYLRYLQFQPPMGKCEVCGDPVGEVM